MMMQYIKTPFGWVEAPTHIDLRDCDRTVRVDPMRIKKLPEKRILANKYLRLLTRTETDALGIEDDQ